MLTKFQKEQHDKWITGSKMPTILGLNPWESPWALFCKMAGVLEDDFKGNARTKKGEYMEPAMADYCKKELGWNLIEQPEGKKHPTLPFFGLPDRLRLGSNGKPDAVVEFKYVGWNMRGKWIDDDNFIVPDYVEPQPRFYSILYKLPAVVFAFIEGCDDPAIIDLPRNPEIEDFLTEKGLKFFDDLHADPPRYPEPDASDSCTQTLQKMFARNDGEMIPGDQNLLDHAIIYKRASQEEKEAEKIKKLHGNFLRAAIDTKDGVLFDDGSKATWKRSEGRLVFNQKKFEAENIELAQRYYEPVPGFRSLRVTIKKEV